MSIVHVCIYNHNKKWKTAQKECHVFEAPFPSSGKLKAKKLKDN